MGVADDDELSDSEAGVAVIPSGNHFALDGPPWLPRGDPVVGPCGSVRPTAMRLYLAWSPLRTGSTGDLRILTG